MEETEEEEKNGAMEIMEEAEKETETDYSVLKTNASSLLAHENITAGRDDSLSICDNRQFLSRGPAPPTNLSQFVDNNDSDLMENDNESDLVIDFLSVCNKSKSTVDSEEEEVDVSPSKNSLSEISDRTRHVNVDRETAVSPSSSLEESTKLEEKSFEPLNNQGSFNHFLGSKTSFENAISPISSCSSVHNEESNDFNLENVFEPEANLSSKVLSNASKLDEADQSLATALDDSCDTSKSEKSLEALINSSEEIINKLEEMNDSENKERLLNESAGENSEIIEENNEISEEGELEEGELEDEDDIEETKKEEQDGNASKPDSALGKDPNNENKSKDKKEASKRKGDDDKSRRKKRKHQHFVTATVGSEEDGENGRKKREKNSDFDSLLKHQMYLMGSGQDDIFLEGENFENIINLLHKPPEEGESFDSGTGDEWEAKSTRRRLSNRKRRGSRSPSRKIEAACMFYLQGSCRRANDCPYSHEITQTRKMELCKFYMMDCCAKKDKCLYMHKDFPCKYYHFGFKCKDGEVCRFSHNPLQEITKNILLKHIELAPKDILGDFPRVSKHNAPTVLSVTEAKRKGEPIPVENLESVGDYEGKGFRYLDRALKSWRKSKSKETGDDKDKIVCDKVLENKDTDNDKPCEIEENNVSESDKDIEKDKAVGPVKEEVTTKANKTANDKDENCENEKTEEKETEKMEIVKDSEKDKSERKKTKTEGKKEKKSKGKDDRDRDKSSKSRRSRDKDEYRDRDRTARERRHNDRDKGRVKPRDRDRHRSGASRNNSRWDSMASEQKPRGDGFSRHESLPTLGRHFSNEQREERIMQDSLRSRGNKRWHPNDEESDSKSSMERRNISFSPGRRTNEEKGYMDEKPYFGDDSYYANEIPHYNNDISRYGDDKSHCEEEKSHYIDDESRYDETNSYGKDTTRNIIDNTNLANIDFSILKNVLKNVKNKSNQNQPEPSLPPIQDKQPNTWDNKVPAPYNHAMNYADDIRDVFYDDPPEQPTESTDFSRNLTSFIQNARESVNSTSYDGGNHGPKEPLLSLPNRRSQRNVWSDIPLRHPSLEIPSKSDPSMQRSSSIDSSVYEADKSSSAFQLRRDGSNALNVETPKPETERSKNDFSRENSDVDDEKKCSIYDLGTEESHDTSLEDEDRDDLTGIPFKVPSHAAAKEIDATITSYSNNYYRLVLVTIPKANFSRLKFNLDDPKLAEDPRIKKIFRRSSTEEVKCESDKSPPPSTESQGDPRINRDPRSSRVNSDPRSVPNRQDSINSDPRLDNRTPSNDIRLDPRMSNDSMLDPRASNDLRLDPRSSSDGRMDPRASSDHMVDLRTSGDPRSINSHSDPRMMNRMDPRSVNNRMDPREAMMMDNDPRGNMMMDNDARGNMMMDNDPRGNMMMDNDPRGNMMMDNDPRGNMMMDNDPRGNMMMDNDPRGNGPYGMMDGGGSNYPYMAGGPMVPLVSDPRGRPGLLGASPNGVNMGPMPNKFSMSGDSYGQRDDMMGSNYTPNQGWHGPRAPYNNDPRRNCYD